MSSCPIDHSLEDVRKKLNEQKLFLPEAIAEGVKSYLTEAIPQEALNDIFHLLKKYDLANAEERRERDTQLVKYTV